MDRQMYHTFNSISCFGTRELSEEKQCWAFTHAFFCTVMGAMHIHSSKIQGKIFLTDDLHNRYAARFLGHLAQTESLYINMTMSRQNVLTICICAHWHLPNPNPKQNKKYHVLLKVPFTAV